MEKVSESTKKVMEKLVKWIKEHGYSPTLRELCGITGLKSTWTIRHHLKKLQESGFITIKPNLSRNIFLNRNITGIPVLGSISAGKPIDAAENIEGYLDLADMFSDYDSIFALRVKGDSMTGAGIFNKDIVFVKKQPVVLNGEIVVALIGEEAVVKRFFLMKDSIKLVSENPVYEPIIDKNISILGKVIAVFRNYRAV